MSERVQTALIHIGGVLVVALAVWISTLIKGTDEQAIMLRGMLIGGAAGLYGKLGFKPASPVLNSIIEKLARKEPERVQRLTNQPPPPPAATFEGFTEVHAPDGSLVGYVPKKQEPKP